MNGRLAAPVSRVVRPLRYSINVTLDGCRDPRAIVPDEEMHLYPLKLVSRLEFGSGAMVLRYEPRR
jgi:hypothetical protein